MTPLPKWVVDNRTAVEREAAPWRNRSPEEHQRATAAACRAAARQLANRPDRARLLEFRDPLPDSTLAALRRLRGGGAPGTMTPPIDAFEAGLRIAGALERQRVAYALGGALAYGQYGIPRATNDVDVNVFVDPPSLAPVVAALRSLGIEVDDDAARSQAEAQGLFVVRFADMRVDVFTPSIDFAWEAERTRVRHIVDGMGVWFLSAEALCVFKLLFFRSKDVVDLERLIAVQREALDRGYVRARLVEIMGPDDPRVETWDRLWADRASS